ncbi:MAG: ATP-binding protein [Sphaerospermopsis sp. SIO1G1]|nr:ATP-binding protein [Sphaerospermopsis sp. SIO1G1]
MSNILPNDQDDSRQKQSLKDVYVVDSQNVTFNQTQIIQISVEKIKTQKFIKTSPYKGLEKFEREDQDRFFGRDQFLTQLAKELEPEETKTKLILLLGASGSGKSSVIRAGLLPKLQEKWGKKLVSLTFNPDQQPFESLYSSLRGNKYKQAEAEIARTCNSKTLTEVVTKLKQPEEHWFIFIDQFEELFTSSLEDQRDHFIGSLVQLVEHGDSRVKIVATMRADFMNRLSPYPDLVKATDKHRPMITEMFQDELRQVIEQPAAQHGVVFETGLVEEIIKNVQGQAGYLPLLQYTLDLLWETELQTEGFNISRTLNRTTYQKLGGVRGALQEHIDKFYNSLFEPEKITTQRIFLKLVDIGSDDELGEAWIPVRRRTSRSEFGDKEQEVLSKLIDEKLLVSNSNQNQESTIELAHEILLTSWTTLTDWIKDNRQAIALRNRLSSDVSLWESKKSDSDLWAGSKLEQILELQNNETFNNILGGFSELSLQFINASVGLRDRQRQRELEQERKARKASQRVTVALATSIIILISAGGTIGWREQQKKQEFEDLTLGIPTQNLIRIFQSLINEGNRLKTNKDLATKQNLQREAFARYLYVFQNITQIQQEINQEQRPEEQKQFFDSNQKELQHLSQKSEDSLTELTQIYHLPKLEEYLKKGRFGNFKSGSKLSEQEKRYESNTALQWTYIILMKQPSSVDINDDFGLGADLNRNGVVEGIEAKMIPCATFKKIEELWRKYTNNKCAWTDGESFFDDQDCDILGNQTLTLSVFEASSIGSIKPRLQACEIIPPDPQ